MPIYAYRCASCGHAKDVLQRIADAPLTQCPSCGAATFSKQVTAAGFQLKGSGWYATDFKGNGTKKPDSVPGDKTDAGTSEAAKPDKSDSSKTDSVKTDSVKTDTQSGDSSKPAKSGDSSSAPAGSSPSSPPKAAGRGGADVRH
jgi:putative FmdB family regulatory protein